MSPTVHEKGALRWLNPVTAQRLRRFRNMRRGWYSFWILTGLYVLSLGVEFLAGNRPLWVRFEGRNYFPLFRRYPEHMFTGSGRMTPPDYKAIARSEAFRSNPNNRMVFPLIPYGPYESVAPENLRLPEIVEIRLVHEARVSSLDVNRQGVIVGAERPEDIFGRPVRELIGRKLSEVIPLPPVVLSAIERRMANQPAPRLRLQTLLPEGQEAEMALPTFSPRESAPSSVRIYLRELDSAGPLAQDVRVTRAGVVRADSAGILWSRLSPQRQQQLLEAARARFEGPVDEIRFVERGRQMRASFYRPSVTFPFRPTLSHPLGLDSSGRDVLVRILYGLRTSMTFALLLVMASMVVAVLVGGAQGYYGGRIDLVGQRAVEIWDAMPFLYVLMLLGSVFGRSFGVLLLGYGLFNWVGLSYYMRAEFLRLRKQPFVEAAWCLGLPARKIMFRHILPNAIAPLVTFFPFMLVGAVGVLTALDYLGFGLPPPTPSWGELLSQAQEYSWAWWLTLYPSLALFLVTLLGVFIGEGLRSAFDPHRYVVLR